MKLSEHEIFKYVTQHISDPRLWAIALDLQIMIDGQEKQLAQLEEENEALKNFLRQVKAMMRERYQPHVIERQIDALLTDLKEVAQSTKEISTIPEDTPVANIQVPP